MAADHPAGRTGGIEQYAIKGFAVPPVCAGGIGDDQRGLKLQPLQVFADPLQSFLFDIQRDELNFVAYFQQMTGFPSRCGAGIQDPHPRLRCQ